MTMVAIPPVRTRAVSLTESGAVKTVAISWLEDGRPAGGPRLAVTHTVTAATAAAPPRARTSRRTPSRPRAGDRWQLPGACRFGAQRILQRGRGRHGSRRGQARRGLPQAGDLPGTFLASRRVPFESRPVRA